MAIYLDSAIHDEVREAMEWGFVAGITTNPTLLAASGDISLDALKPLCKLVPGKVFYQLTARRHPAMLLEAQAAFSVSPSQVVLKVPCTLDGLQAVARLSLEIPCAVTAVFSPAQAFMAREAGAQYVITYVNRSTEVIGDVAALIGPLAMALESRARGSAELMAANIKSPSQAVATLNAGARHMTLPFDVIKEMARHPLSEQAVERFDLAVGGA